MLDEDTRYTLTTGPRNRSLRAADRDRDAVAARLRREHLIGRLDDVELEDRLERCLAAKRYGELDALIADFPPEPRAAQATRPRRGRQLAAALLVALVALIWLLSLLGWAAHRHAFLLPGRFGAGPNVVQVSPNPSQQLRPQGSTSP